MIKITKFFLLSLFTIFIFSSTPQAMENSRKRKYSYKPHKKIIIEEGEITNSNICETFQCGPLCIWCADCYPRARGHIIRECNQSDKFNFIPNFTPNILVPFVNVTM